MSSNGSPREAYRSKEWKGLTPTPSLNSPRMNTQLKRGLVLVFDMDDTIAPYIGRNNNRSAFSLNPEMIAILKKAVEIKGATPEEVSGIFLYTNNSDKKYIDFIHGLVSKEVGVLMNVFDDILWASPGISNSRQKTLFDIEGLCEDHNISTEDLANRVYFFDDQIHPDLYYRLPNGHYVLIKSHVPSMNNNKGNSTIQGYSPGLSSATNLRSVHAALGMSGMPAMSGMSGMPAMSGGRRLRKTRKNKKKTLKQKHS